MQEKVNLSNSVHYRIYIFPTILSSAGVSVHAAMIEADMTNHGIT